MTEEIVHDHFISKFNDSVKQCLLQEKVLDNPNLSVLVASDYILC